MIKKIWKQMTNQNPEEQAELQEEPQQEPPAEELNLQTETEPGAIARWMQRRQITPQMETTIEQLAQTSEKLNLTLEKLAQVSELHGKNLDLLSQNQEKFITLLDRQGKTLADMLSEVQRLTSATDRLTNALEAVPKSSREQSDKLSAIEDQLQSGGQTDRALLGSMDTLGRNVASLARYAETQQANPKDVTKDFSSQLLPLVELATQQNKYSRYTFNTVILIFILFLLFIVGNLVDIF